MGRALACHPSVARTRQARRPVVHRPLLSPRRHGQRGLTLVELIVAFTIMMVLTTMSVPLARTKVRIMRERELRADLREMRAAIDKYKDYADLGYLGPQKLGTNNWPETLDILVEGVKLPGPDGKKMRFLRRVPQDPFTGTDIKSPPPQP